MEVDRILYIFGSFTRKKDKRKSFEQSSISAGNSPLRRPNSIAPRTSAYEDVKEVKERKRHEVKQWNCGLCRKELAEPRLLACLHSFCTRCLQGLPQEGEAEGWSEIDGGSTQQDPGSSGGSAGSGYESDPRRSGSDASWEQKQRKYGIFTRKISGKSVQLIICPTCAQETQLPLGGVSALPLNYVLLRKMAGESRASVLCDLCNCDNRAQSRCDQCLVSVCESCGEAHSRQKTTARHSLQPLHAPATLCSQHRAELCVYCATCQQVVCRDCCLISHSGHALANAARAAAERARLLQDACDRARLVPENVDRATRMLNIQAQQVDSQAARVEEEVQTWGAQYLSAVEAHVRALAGAAARARARHAQRADEQARVLAQREQHALEAVEFAEELLSSGRSHELLSLHGSVLRRLERLTELPPAPPRLELRLAPTAPAAHDATLVGRLLTQAADPDRCVVNTEGFQDLRVDCPHEAMLELRDSSGERIWCGGEQVAGYFRRSDSSARPQSARVSDRGDGLYSLTVTPPSPGAYLLAVTVNNKPVKGSPFQCAARACQPHSGQFHCCSFCSSGGRRDAHCACPGHMPGYRGCGHGHAGHPGARHWSCCGSTARRGPCERASLYHFSV
ncbi:E3 ubiquitin-protein ligase TRIM45 isoform X1 [Cydia pomonella]|uniref:E3 ubiquitin-protein ligase TRIM45 isoform X1 n=1 Tax=Cydia pomonella TaxID=82600 RepID=UPI002ADD39C8|nr:E3 ubiquitin-protein ligase TRIM45 isoform X1 [Cydia pomonella]